MLRTTVVLLLYYSNVPTDAQHTPGAHGPYSVVNVCRSSGAEEWRTPEAVPALTRGRPRVREQELTMISAGDCQDSSTTRTAVASSTDLGHSNFRWLILAPVPAFSLSRADTGYLSPCGRDG